MKDRKKERRLDALIIHYLKNASEPSHVCILPQCGQETEFLVNPERFMFSGTSIPVGTGLPVVGHLMKSIAIRCGLIG